MKKLKQFGVTDKEFSSRDEARGYTYTTNDDKLIPTNLTPNENPFPNDITNAKFILDIGCGVGRNLQWIMENTNAIYIGLDPNESMLKYFWDWQNPTWQSRVQLHTSFDSIPSGMIFDVVVCTFVFQHIGFRPNNEEMNISDITNKVKEFTREGTIWFLYEHEEEEPDWIIRWIHETGLYPNRYIRNYTGLEELTHRGLHHLMIIKEKK